MYIYMYIYIYIFIYIMYIYIFIYIYIYIYIFNFGHLQGETGGQSCKNANFCTPLFHKKSNPSKNFQTMSQKFSFLP